MIEKQNKTLRRRWRSEEREAGENGVDKEELRLMIKPCIAP
jgi:hypothetical protein